MTCAPLTSLLSAVEAPQPPWYAPPGPGAAHQSARPPALHPRVHRLCAVQSRGTGSAAWPSAGAGSPAMPARRRKPQTMVLFDAVQRRAGLLDFKQPLQPPRRGYPACMIGARRYLALR